MMEEMSAVTEFMDGFDDDIETKWGLSRDPELGEKIKVTILATGFGVKVEDGEMNITDQKAMSAAEIRNKRAQEAAEQNLIQNYYGKTGPGNERLRPRFFLFSNEDLDNDNLISAVEATPTYKRSKLQYDELVRQSKGDIELNAPATTKAAPVSGTIKFG